MAGKKSPYKAPSQYLRKDYLALIRPRAPKRKSSRKKRATSRKAIRKTAGKLRGAMGLPNIRKKRGGGGGRAMKGAGRRGKLRPFAKKHMAFLSMLAQKGLGKQKDALIDTMTKSQLQAYKSTMRDLVRKKFSVPPKVMKKLQRDKKYIYALLDHKTPESTQRAIMKHKGGFLGSLIMPLVGSILPSLMEPVIGGIASAFKRRR